MSRRDQRVTLIGEPSAGLGGADEDDHRSEAVSARAPLIRSSSV